MINHKRFLVPIMFYGGGIDYVDFDSEDEFLKIKALPVEEYNRMMYSMLLEKHGFEVTEENLKEIMPHMPPMGLNDPVFPVPKLTRKADDPIVRPSN